MNYKLDIFATKHIYNLVAVPVFYFNSENNTFYYEKWAIDLSSSKNVNLTKIEENEYNILVEIIKRVLVDPKSS